MDIFSLNTSLDANLNADCNLPSQRFKADISPRIALPCLKKNFPKTRSIVSMNHSLDNLLMLLDELEVHLNVIGITETKITNSNESNLHPSIPGYVFEYVPTPLASGGAGLFVD